MLRDTINLDSFVKALRMCTNRSYFGPRNRLLSWVFEIPFCWYDLFSVKSEIDSRRNFFSADSPSLLLDVAAVVDGRFVREPMEIPVLARFDVDVEIFEESRFIGGAMSFFSAF